MPKELLSVEAARERFFSSLPTHSADAETVALRDALGRVTAETVLSLADLPPFERSAVDGYALRSAEAHPHRRLELVGEVRMGHAPAVTVEPGTCVAVPTGGMLPAGADAVIMVEDTVAAAGNEIELHKGVASGANVVRRGEDVRGGEVLVPAGRLVRAAEVGALAGAGITRLSIWRRPRVAVLSSGDEVVPPDAEPGPAQVRDINAASLAAMLVRDGCEPLRLGIVADRPEAVRAALRGALDAADAVLISGGSSVGRRDFVPGVLDELGRPGVLVHGVAIKPGKPVALAVIDGKIAVGVPGHPVSALVIYELFVRPALRRLAGEERPAPRGGVRAPLAEDIVAPAERDFFCNVRLDGMQAWPVKGGSPLIATLVQADGLVRVPAGERRRAGEEVWVELLL